MSTSSPAQDVPTPNRSCTAYPTGPGSENRPLTRISPWIPLSAFLGTSLALAIPLLMIRRKRVSVLRVSLSKNLAAPPPRRASGPATPIRPSTASSSNNSPILASSESDSTSPGIGEMMSALSKLNASTAFMAARAFAIATGLVAVGGFTFTWGVKTALGVQDTREFGHKMRLLLWSSVPSLTSRIHRAPETDEERRDSHSLAPFGVHEEWKWEEAEERMNRAYEEGGFPLWAQAALREVEAEVRVERARREREWASESKQNSAE